MEIENNGNALASIKGMVIMNETVKASQGQLLDRFVHEQETAAQSASQIRERIYEAVGRGSTREEKIQSGRELFVQWELDELAMRGGYIVTVGNVLDLNVDEKNQLHQAATALKRELRKKPDLAGVANEIGVSVEPPNRRPVWRGR
jgi:hypothetical protein